MSSSWTLTIYYTIGFAFQLIILLYLYRIWVALKARYAFYAIRDKLIQLVADGYLNEDSDIFQHFYSWSNTFAKDARSLNIPALVKTLSHTDPSSPEIRELLEMVQQSDERVKVVIAEYSFTIADVLIRSSFLVYILFYSMIIFRALGNNPTAEQRRTKDRYTEIDICRQVDIAGDWREESKRLQPAT